MLYFFRVGDFADSMTNLGKMISTLSLYRCFHDFDVEKERRRILAQLRVIRDQIGGVGMTAVLNGQWDRCEQALENMRLDNIDTRVVQIRELQENLLTELAQPRYLVIPPDRAALIEEKAPFGEGVTELLPAATTDILEGVKCYALERWTAAVFHLMRAAEHAVRYLARGVGVEHVEEKDMGQLIQETHDKHRALSSRDSEKKWSADALASLDLFKDAWRNPVNHARDDHYTEERARDVFNGTRALMQSLAREVAR